MGAQVRQSVNPLSPLTNWVWPALLSCLFLFAFSQQGYTQPNGEKLFNQNCARCHNIHSEFTGPALKGVNERKSKDWLHQWIKNSSAVLAQADEGSYAQKIYEEYDKTEMPAFPNLNEKEIDAILAFIKKRTKEGPATVQPGGGQKSGQAQGQGSPTTVKTILIITAIILLIIVIVLSRISASVNSLVREKTDEPVPAPITWRKVVMNKKFGVLATLGVLVFISVAAYKGAASLGRQQGYQPEQPIAFSHKIHAGKNKIDCKYCHFGAEKSKNAGIPPMNVCMNCHNAVKEYPQKVYNGNTGTEEIQKLLKHYENKEPIKWTKVHNLPDFVYFNHSQHVKVAGIDCQKCHGKVEEMSIVKQKQPLSMGWCINCHRKTKVNFKSNHYYDIYEELHKDLEEGKIDKVTAASIGATNCQSCHY